MSKIFGTLIVIFLSLISVSFAENKIAFIDIDKIINESEFGKRTYKNIDVNFKEENEKLLEIEKKLVSKEQEILKQKNILSEDELNKKITKLKKEINDFQKKRKSINEKFNKIRLEKTNEMVQSLNEILSKYADDNNISLVIQKKFIVIAKTGLDITNEILKIFNKENK
tara:strand:+ start:943 stop:1449 length:507 start_codon:yes stop_codon:yes gene_type:complete